MGRIGDVFRKVGRGIVTGAKWAGNKIVRPIASIISNPLVSGGLAMIGGPIGAGIAAAGNIVDAGFKLYDSRKGENIS